jgi:hypothetical protein
MGEWLARGLKGEPTIAPSAPDVHPAARRPAMLRLTPFPFAAAVVLVAAACGNGPTTPSADVRKNSAQNSTDTTTTAQPRQETEEEITLVGSSDFPNVVGRARFESGEEENEGGDDAPAASDGSDGSGGSEGAELEIRVENAGSLAGTKVTFSLGGVAIGTAMVSSDGEARLKLESEDGGTVPKSVSGQTVEVRTADGVLIVSGTF